ncbi:BZ3500_MvSof-1268-A1-R1_Chr9g10520 [Microbotryum saponariae]|uniref:BZ3500_MvSof-1268-A1-R1_Chr9g10520 protein n=1 Tax=Microbotryum saponariae TaxID=289078 RepID=A0A2X0KDQ0_9BASI|nr:BZ3501_MvSof-1269-A2-R1_Chr9g10269 [Microbotryum saponariae]SDA00231.1 BZ3500_MvSof-1268-A1-R1_Chr9g10520 [Microbotryum saponariae]
MDSDRRRPQASTSSSFPPASGSSNSSSHPNAARPSLVPGSSTSRQTMSFGFESSTLSHSASTGSLDSVNGRRSTPNSPSKKKVYGDRFIPNRDGMDLQTSFSLIQSASSSPLKGKRKTTVTDHDHLQDDANKTFSALLKSELFGPDSVDSSSLRNSPSSRTRSVSHNSITTSPSSPSSGKKLFSFTSPSRKRVTTAERERVIGLDSPTHERYSVSPVRYESQKLLLSPKKQQRAMSRVPFKVLDAPELADDYYLNLIDWSAHNVLAVGLGSSIYTWSAHTSEVKKLCDLSENAVPDSITSLAWVQRGHQLAVGTKNGSVQIWDAQEERVIRKMSGHTGRVGALSWNDAILSSGSHDRSILHRDVRVHEHWVGKLTAHRQEVCGLKWNDAGDQLASGGNDNRLFVYEKMNEAPTHRFTEHVAAIKAIAWSPHQHGVLASGGGTADVGTFHVDMKLRFWNTSTGTLLNEIDTGSQVRRTGYRGPCAKVTYHRVAWDDVQICNLLWSKNSNELVSTHGFSAGQAQNQVVIWRYPSMTQVATLQGHTYRVLYLAASPDGQVIVTGAGDETLRFWQTFPKSKSERRGEVSMLNPFSSIR